MADVIKTIGSGKDYPRWVNYYNNYLNTSPTPADPGKPFNNDNEISEIYGDVQELGDWNINTGNTNVNQQIIVTSGDNRHAGILDATKDIIRPKTSGSPAININDDFVQFIDLQIESNLYNRNGLDIKGASGGKTIIARCIVSGFGATSGSALSILTSNLVSGHSAEIYENAIFGPTSSAFYGGIYLGANADSNTLVYNNTLYGLGSSPYSRMSVASHASSAAIIKHNIVNHSNVAQNQYGLSGSHTTNANISEDATSPDGASFQNKTVSFVDGPNGDVHLAVGETFARDSSNVEDLGPPYMTDFENESSTNLGCDGDNDTFGGNGGIFPSSLISGIMTRDTKTSELSGIYS